MADGKSNTQEQFAKLVKISQPEVSKLIRKGTLTRGAPIGQWFNEYIDNLRAQAAQHKSEDGIDAVREGALLKRAQREEIEIRLAQLRNELWPVAAIARVLHQHNTNAKNRWLSLPQIYKSICPHIASRDIDRLDNLVRENLSESINDQLPPGIVELVQQYFAELHAAAQIDGQPMGRPPSTAEPRKQRRPRSMAHRPHPLSEKNNGRG